MGKYKVVRPSYDKDGDSDSDLDFTSKVSYGKNNHDDDDNIESISFGTLNSAQEKLMKSRNKSKHSRSNKSFSEEEDSGSDQEEEGFFDEESDSDEAPQESSSRSNFNKTKKNKHAPSESSTKKRVSRIREIPGLETKKSSSLYTDIRFDPAYGKADLAQIRKNYAFLDDYRQKEINDMQLILKDKKSGHLLGEREKEDIKLKIQSLKSRLDTMKNRDLERKILSEHKNEQLKKVKTGQQSTPYFLKKSDKRKMIQKAKFDTMKTSQREKVMERKRKRRLGKEFRNLEFNQLH